MQKGKVYLIGAGPGDPGLITVKGRECIARADVILYDHLANDELLAFARSDAELIYAGKVGGAHNREQRQINEMLVEKALAGKVVARLKGGIPSSSAAAARSARHWPRQASPLRLCRE